MLNLIYILFIYFKSNQDAGDYKCLIKQIKSNNRVSTEQVLFKLKVIQNEDFYSSKTKCLYV